MALEQEQLDAQRSRLRDRNLAEYMGQIQATVNRNWIRPPGATKGLKCTVRVEQIPGGQVVRVVITKSSGNVAFDRSVENAVLKSSPLPQPKDPSLFDRELKFEFEPED
jgi:colicin import membrane protein